MAPTRWVILLCFAAFCRGTAEERVSLKKWENLLNVLSYSTQDKDNRQDNVFPGEATCENVGIYDCANVRHICENEQNGKPGYHCKKCPENYKFDDDTFNCVEVYQKEFTDEFNFIKTTDGYVDLQTTADYDNNISSDFNETTDGYPKALDEALLFRALGYPAFNETIDSFNNFTRDFNKTTDGYVDYNITTDNYSNFTSEFNETTDVYPNFNTTTDNYNNFTSNFNGTTDDYPDFNETTDSYNNFTSNFNKTTDDFVDYNITTDNYYNFTSDFNRTTNDYADFNETTDSYNNFTSDFKKTTVDYVDFNITADYNVNITSNFNKIEVRTQNWNRNIEDKSTTSIEEQTTTEDINETIRTSFPTHPNDKTESKSSKSVKCGRHLCVNGKCENETANIEDFKCSCFYGYSGVRCDEKTTYSLDKKLVWIIVFLLAAVVILQLFTTCCFMIKRRR